MATVRASGAPVASLNAAAPGGIGVIWSSKLAPRTAWLIVTVPRPVVTGLPATAVTVEVALSFWTSLPSQLTWM